MVRLCGSGAFGYFETTADGSDLTKVKFLGGKGVKMPIFMRFSIVTLGREFPDSARNPQGFAIKFYTGEGNYDIFKVIKVGYLAQLWNIDPSYAKAIYDLFPESATTGEEGFEFVEVQTKAKGADVAGKEAKFRPSWADERLVGFSPEMVLYNM